jgi:hypothetical protein
MGLTVFRTTFGLVFKPFSLKFMANIGHISTLQILGGFFLFFFTEAFLRFQVSQVQGAAFTANFFPNTFHKCATFARLFEKPSKPVELFRLHHRKVFTGPEAPITIHQSP